MADSDQDAPEGDKERLKIRDTVRQDVLCHDQEVATPDRGSTKLSGSRALRPQPELGVRAVQLSVSHDGAYAAAAGTSVEVMEGHAFTPPPQNVLQRTLGSA